MDGITRFDLHNQAIQERIAVALERIALSLERAKKLIVIETPEDREEKKPNV